VLVLPAYSAWQIVTLPRLAEVTTDPVRPPAFVFDQGARATGSADAALQKEAYPDVVPRRYPVDVVKVFAEARRLVGARGWDVLDATQPANVRSTGRIEAVARTVVFGLREDVAIRFEPDGSGTRVDMRSASRYGAHDMGSNAERVRAFLNDLDFAIAGRRPPHERHSAGLKVPVASSGPSAATMPRSTRSSRWASTDRPAAPVSLGSTPR
jgi:hypothetical protein